jgi:hypothetical protein
VRINRWVVPAEACVMNTPYDDRISPLAHTQRCALPLSLLI